MTAHSPAEPAAVYAALIRAGTWPLWSPIGEAQIEGGGDPGEPQKVGDTRIFRTGSHVARERVVALEEDRRFVYENLGGPFRAYRGTVDLAPSARGGTDITWSAVFVPKLPFSGPFWRRYLTKFMKGMAEGLAAYAGR
ncbi:SRPBCC family protein [Nonomuraea sp. NPDC050790]|uniref:SRPBCC family protein n=1 Tax=Nonomuraea sp. NPDC050790 TaxID=3364371 RepID=UPI0037B223C7